jgi:hypothetical protein
VYNSIFYQYGLKNGTTFASTVPLVFVKATKGVETIQNEKANLI